MGVVVVAEGDCAQVQDVSASCFIEGMGVEGGIEACAKSN